MRADGTVTLNLSNKKTLTLSNYWSDKINTVKAVKDVKAINIVRNYDSSVTVKGTSVADYIENDGSNVTISALGGNDSVKNWNANVSIDGGAGDDEILNSGDNVTISGGKGNDFVYSWGVGTAYVYSAGNDTLDGFNEDDTIVLGSVKVNSSVSADGTVTLNLSNKKTLTLQNYWSDKINTVKAVEDVKAINVVRNYDSSVSVEGSSADGYIENGGAGNDTLWGDGSGSSKIYGSEEVDTFIYRPGGDNDIICDYESGELLQILDADFSDSSFKNDKLTLTIDAVGRDSVIFGGVSKSDSFNINGSKLK